MKRFLLSAVVALLAIVGSLHAPLQAQDFTDADTLRFVDALDFRMINYAFDRSFESRIPLTLRDSVRTTLWERAQCTSGKAIRFATNSRAVAVRYNLLTNMHMMHLFFTDTATTEIYTLESCAHRQRCEAA